MNEWEDFRKYAYDFVDWSIEYLKSIEDYPVKAQIQPGELREQLPLVPR